MVTITGFPGAEPANDDGSEHHEVRDYFIALFAKHMPDADPPPSRDNIDAAVLLHINIAVAAHKTGQPDPYPWFSSACAFLFANDLEAIAYRAAGETPTHH